MKPLDEQQQRHLDGLRQGVTLRSRRGAFLYGFTVGGAVVGGAVGGAATASHIPWFYCLLGVVVVAVACGALAAWIGPETILQVMVRSQMPSEESLERGVSRFQIDGGRAWKADERPPPKYWDT